MTRSEAAPATRSDVVRQLIALGVQRGGVLLVHTAFSSVGPIERGPRGLIGALREAIGADGTLVMPSMSDDDQHPFDRDATPCIGMGIVAETFRRLPGVRRSDNPHAFAAIGPRAATIVAPHPLDEPHGHGSPVGRVFDADGQVLLLGVGHDANTTIHLAEMLACVRYRRMKWLATLQNGRLVRLAYGEVDHCCQRFALLDEWLDATGLQRRGIVGRGAARLMRSRDVVGVAVDRLQTDETVFLHASGACDECDDARASLA